MPKLFVIMPFGVRPAAADHLVPEINFDEVYIQAIRPVGLASGWAVLRIDELLTGGNIQDQYLKELFSADLLVADISLPNGNVFYELGIRQSISTGGTILIAVEGTKLPFDLTTQRVLFYKNNVDGYADLSLQIKMILKDYKPEEWSNPVASFLQKLGITSSPAADNVAFERELEGRIGRAKNVDQMVAVWQWAQYLSPLPAVPLLLLAERLAELREWETSVEVLRAAARHKPADFEIQRQLGWHLSKVHSKEHEALEAFQRALALNPSDPETLGMVGGLFKRQANYTEAGIYYARAAAVSPHSLYARVNQAAMSILADPLHPQKGVDLYRTLLQELQNDENLASDVWAELVSLEAAFSIGETDKATRHFDNAVRLSPSPLALRSVAEQLELLASVGFRSDDARKLAAKLKQAATRTGTEALQVSAVSAPRPTEALPVILHLSDIHFGQLMRNGQTVQMHRFYDGEYSKSLFSHLISEFCATESYFRYPPEKIYLIVSGDLTYTADQGEFVEVLNFLRQLSEAMKIPVERVFLVPGNHDVHWRSAEVSTQNRFDHYIGFLSDFYGESLFRERYPYVQWNLRITDKRPIPSELISVYSDGKLTIIGMNSCVYETPQDHYGFIGGRQLDLVADALRQLKAMAEVPKIGIFHHHVHPFPEPLATREKFEVWQDLSTIRDAGLVERRLARLGFDLILHGHKHKPQLRESLVRDRDEKRVIPNKMIICGAGSTGVNSAELEHNRANHYEVIELLNIPRVEGAEFIQVEWRELAVAPEAEWTTTLRVRVKG